MATITQVRHLLLPLLISGWTSVSLAKETGQAATADAETNTVQSPVSKTVTAVKPTSAVKATDEKTAPLPPRRDTVPAPKSGLKALVVSTTRDPLLKFAFEVTPRYFVGTNDINHTTQDPTTGDRSFNHYLAPTVDSQYGSLYLHAAVQAPYRVSQQAGAIHLHLDTGEIYRGTVTRTDVSTGQSTDEETFLSNEQSLTDEFAENYFIRQLYLEHTFGAGKHVTLGLGKGNPIVGHGLIYNDYSPYVRLRFASQKAWAIPMELEVTLLSPSTGLLPEESVIGNIELALSHPIFGRLSLFAAHLRDRSDSVAESFRQVITASAQSQAKTERSLLTGQIFPFNRLTTFSSTTDVNWFGGGYTKYWSAGHSVWMNGCFSLGDGQIEMDMSRFLSVSRRNRAGSRMNSTGIVDIDLEMRGAAGQVGGSLFLKGDWYLSGFAIAMTGDEGLTSLRDFFKTGLEQGQVSERFGAFLSVVPYLEHTSIFFNGGLDQGFSHRQSTMAGLAGRGVLATGLSVMGTVWGPVSFQGGPAILQAMHEGPHGLGRFYGVELDHLVTWTIGEALSMSLEVDLLYTGDFFPQAAWNTQTTVQVSYAPTGQL